MSVKTAGVGHFQIPTAPAAGVSVTSGSANVYTTTAVQLIASTAAALFITGIHAEAAAASAATYKSVQLMIGGAGAETVIGQYLVPMSTGSTVALGYRPIFPPIPVAISQRISAKTADSVGAQATLITIECIAQSNVVDGGTLEAVNVTQWNGTNVATPATAGIPDVNVKNINNVATTGVTTINANQGTTQPINFTGTAASALVKGDTVDWNGTAVAAPATAGIPEVNVKNINNVSTSPVTTVKAVQGLTTADTITTTTNLTNLPSIPANWLTAAGIAASALNGKGDWNIGKTGYALSAAGVQAIWDALTSALTTVGSIGKLLVDNINATISSRSTYAGGAVASVTAAVTVGTNNDKTGYSLSAAGIQAIWDALTSALTTVGSIGKFIVDNADSAGVTTLLARLTSGRATNLDNLDATVSSRLATSGYTAPPTVAAIRTEMDTNSTKLDATVSSRLAAASYTAPDNADILLIKAKTDNLPAAPAAVSDIPTANANADALLKRDWTVVSGEASRSVMNALRFIRNKFSTTAHAGQVTVYKEDDVTEAFTKTVTTDPTAGVIVEG
jgi:hypothetical protein